MKLNASFTHPGFVDSFKKVEIERATVQKSLSYTFKGRAYSKACL